MFRIVQTTESEISGVSVAKSFWYVSKKSCEDALATIFPHYLEMYKTSMRGIRDDTKTGSFLTWNEFSDVSVSRHTSTKIVITAMQKQSMDDEKGHPFKVTFAIQAEQK